MKVLIIILILGLTGLLIGCEKDPFPVKGYEIEIVAPTEISLAKSDTLFVEAVFLTQDTGLIHNAILRLQDTADGGKTLKKWGGHVHASGKHTIRNHAIIKPQFAGKTLLLWGEAYSHGDDPYRELDSLWVTVLP
jgi:hypothetical protein